MTKLIRDYCWKFIGYNDIYDRRSSVENYNYFIRNYEEYE